MFKPIKSRIDHPELLFWLVALFALLLLGFELGKMSTRW